MVIYAVWAAVVAARTLAPAQPLHPEEAVSLPTAVGVTVYNQGFGLVKENRSIRLHAGRSAVSVDDVAARIEPESVHFESLTAPDSVAVREQSFEYDLMSTEALLNKSVGRRLTVRQAGAAGAERDLTGTLLAPVSQVVPSTFAGQSNATYSWNQYGGLYQSGYSSGSVYNGLMLRTDDGRVALNPSGHIVLHELPHGLIMKPRLTWIVDSTRAGVHNCRVSYLTGGLAWKAAYVAVADSDDAHVDLTGWVTLDNRSGATYRDAALQLVAGDVRRTGTPLPQQVGIGGYGAFGGGMLRNPPPFQQESLFEYHLYTLNGRTTLRNDEQKQMALLTATRVPAKKRFVYDGRRAWWRAQPANYRPGEAYDSSDEHKVDVFLEIRNAKPELGMPLPKGTVKVYKPDSRGNMEFVGEDEIDHTPQDETVLLFVGASFDAVGEHKRTNFRWIIPGRQSEETFEITLRNHRDSNMEIAVVEHLWSDWTIVEKSAAYIKRDAGTVEFPVIVRKGGEAKVTYTVRTQW